MKRVLINGVFCILLLIAINADAADEDLWKKTVGLHCTDATLTTVLDTIAKQTGLSYAYQQGAAETLADAKVSVDISNAPVETALKKSIRL